MCELGDEELSIRKPELKEEINKQFRDIGWYKDIYGYRHYGIIPTTEEEKYGRSRIRTSDKWLFNDTL